MPKQSLTIGIEVPEGWEAYDYDYAAPGTSYLDCNGQERHWPKSAERTTLSRFVLLRKAEVWKQLTPELAVEFYVTKKPITWRFRGCNSIAKKTFVTGLYTSAMGAPCICFPVQDDTLGLRHTIERIDYLEETDG